MNKKLKYHLLNFYSQPFVAFFVAFCIIVYINSRKHFMHHAGLLIFAVIGATILFGTAKMLIDRFLFPSEFDKLVLRRPFSEFIKKGFCVGNGYLKGTVHKYEVLLGYSMQDDRTVRKLYANIIFKPHNNGEFLTEAQIEVYNQNYANTEFRWSYNSLDIEMQFDGVPPYFPDIWKKIKNGIEILKTENLQPSTLADSYNVEKEIWDTLLEHTK